MSDRSEIPSASSPPSASVDGTMDEGRRYWKAAIAHLAPAKREAAWEFYLDRLESSAAADTLGGVMLLLEAHLAFFDDLPARLGVVAQQIDAALQPLGGAGVPVGPLLPSVAPNAVASRVRRRRKLPTSLFIGLAALLGGILGCVGTTTYQHFRALPLPNLQGAARDVFLTRAPFIGVEPWNDAATGRRKGAIIRLSNVAAAERTEGGRAKIYVLSPVEEVRENIQALQQLAR